jgi:hypothetical protein
VIFPLATTHSYLKIETASADFVKTDSISMNTDQHEDIMGNINGNYLLFFKKFFLYNFTNILKNVCK